MVTNLTLHDTSFLCVIQPQIIESIPFSFYWRPVVRIFFFHCLWMSANDSFVVNRCTNQSSVLLPTSVNGSTKPVSICSQAHRISIWNDCFHITYSLGLENFAFYYPTQILHRIQFLSHTFYGIDVGICAFVFISKSVIF